MNFYSGNSNYTPPPPPTERYASGTPIRDGSYVESPRISIKLPPSQGVQSLPLSIGAGSRPGSVIVMSGEITSPVNPSKPTIHAADLKVPTCEYSSLKNVLQQSIKDSSEKTIDGTAAAVKHVMGKHAHEMGRLRELLEMHEKCVDSLRTVLDAKLEKDIKKIHDEISQQELDHKRRMEDARNLAAGLKQEQAAHRELAVEMPEKTIIDDFQERLANFYEKHNPSKLSCVRNTVQQYEGREEELFTILITKYGPEPPPNKDPLPGNWARTKNSRGDIFYVNNITNQRRWDRPTIDD
eukprot:TRINITY_DN22658_c0_g1_i1.p1 TRINITY_DN22658_c0_g1~~TRINITY_DN22658_c0_g1_i1.p1  ORF type:complete len:319 (+),score=79.84 TRINITY_DN22658_c0_g1_i1:70-957(+)